MIEITNLTHGQILNRHHGVETDHGLTVKVRGVARSCDEVHVNGLAAKRCGLEFSAPVELTHRFNEITVTSEGDRGRTEQSIKVVWDKKSFKRAYFFIDDNIFFLTEIAQQRPKSLFDHFYLKMLKRFHDQYGLRVTLNLFFQNDHHPFKISDFPDRYKGEFQENADWLRLAFHAYSEFPDRPYQNATPEKIEADYDLIGTEVERFAGAGIYTPPVVCHWAMMQPAGVQVLRRKGVRVLSGGYINQQTFIGEKISDIPVTDIGFFQSEENARFLMQKRMRYDFRHNLIFNRCESCCNLLELPVLQQSMAELLAEKDIDAVYAMTHEQYFFPDYFNYLPDHEQRMETAVRMIAESDRVFVNFNDGFMGNMEPVPEV